MRKKPERTPRLGYKFQVIKKHETNFKIWHDYRYQLIDTVTKHKNPDDKELDYMNVLTQERPIDDSRYVDFHGL